MPNQPKALSKKELDEIESMAGLGLRYEDIARIKGMSDDTLKKYAKVHLLRGKALAKAQVMQTAFKMAASGKVPAMTMFWLKTQAGWRENLADAVMKENEGPDPFLEALGVSAQRDWSSGNGSQAIAAHLAETLGQVKQGDIDPRVASSIASVANTLMKALAQGELEARLSSLESVLKSQEPEPLEFDL